MEDFNRGTSIGNHFENEVRLTKRNDDCNQFYTLSTFSHFSWKDPRTNEKKEQTFTIKEKLTKKVHRLVYDHYLR